jgi:hypothetical protein
MNSKPRIVLMNPRRSRKPDEHGSIRLPQDVSGVSTRVWKDSEGNTHVTYHSTEVVSFNDRWITLRTGGHQTVTTKKRMNEASQVFDLGYGVWSERGDWYIHYMDTKTEFLGSTMSIPRQIADTSYGIALEKDMVPPTSPMPGAPLPASRRGHWYNPEEARNIAMAGEKETDVQVDNFEGLIEFKLLSENAEKWWKKNVGGKGRTTDPVNAADIIQAMLEDGLNVR